MKTFDFKLWKSGLSLVLAITLLFGGIISTPLIANAADTNNTTSYSYPSKVTKPKKTVTVDIRKNSYFFLHPGEKVKFTGGKAGSWKSSKSGVLSISSNGTATAKTPNNNKSTLVKITGKINGKTHTCMVQIQGSQPYLAGHTIIYKGSKNDDGYDCAYVGSLDTMSYSSKTSKKEVWQNEFIETKWSVSNSSLLSKKSKKDYDVYTFVASKAGTFTVTAKSTTPAGYTYTMKREITIPKLTEAQTIKKLLSDWKSTAYVKVTEEQAKEKIEEFKLIHPQDSKWNSKTYFAGSGGCLGYAAKLSAYIFGGEHVEEDDVERNEIGKLVLTPSISSPVNGFLPADEGFGNPGSFLYDFDKLRPGDVIFLGTGKNNNVTPYHVVVVTGRGTTEDYDYDLNQFVNVDVIYVAEGNSAGKVDYTQSYTKARLEKTRFTAITRYGY